MWSFEGQICVEKHHMLDVVEGADVEIGIMTPLFVPLVIWSRHTVDTQRGWQLQTAVSFRFEAGWSRQAFCAPRIILLHVSSDAGVHHWWRCEVDNGLLVQNQHGEIVCVNGPK